MNSKKAIVTEEHLEEARKLKAIWARTAHPPQAEFGELFGIGNQSAVSQFLNGKTPLSLEAAAGFAKGLGCQIADFSPRLASKVANISEPIPTFGIDNNVIDGPITQGYVPLISSVQAGAWTDIVGSFSYEDAEDWLPCPVKHGPGTFCLRVDGESMKNISGRPSYDPGDVIFVDPNKCAQPGDRVVVKLDNQLQATFKQYIEEDGRKLLKALNPDWKPRYIEINGSATICGVVIGKWVPE